MSIFPARYEKKIFFFLFTLCAVISAGCGEEASTGHRNTVHKVTAGRESAQAAPAQREAGCRGCHGEVAADKKHTFACEQCHLGNPRGSSRDEAHAGLIAKPAHPAHMAATCGRCHPRQVEECGRSLHFTLRNEVNLVRRHFGATSDLADLTQIPRIDPPTTALELADDLLRRRCLRCHPYTSGDTYRLTERGTGCAACHMAFVAGRQQSHVMERTPSDRQCLSCHYANHVGADYYGRFEHDFSDDFRTPLVTRATSPTDSTDSPDYGVEYHQLRPDIHQQRGLSCVDCHDGRQLMSDAAGPSCASCHSGRPEDADQRLPGNVTITHSGLLLTTRLTGETRPIPRAIHPAHARYGQLVACQVCHGQWSFDDSITHLLRSDSAEYEEWLALTTQSDAEVEQFLTQNLFGAGEESAPVLRDGITGEKRPGVWLQGFDQRRWENMLVRRDHDGLIKVFRPILDLRLSALDAEENILFDNIRGEQAAWLPYTPHTTGPAGIFFLQRFVHLLDPNPSNQQAGNHEQHNER